MKKQGNISIVIILLLVLSTTAGFLILHFVKQLAVFSGGFLSYYKAFYLANAGIELQLSKIAYHDYGFEDRIESGSVLFQEVSCKNKLCSLEVENIALGSTILSPGIYQTGCSEEYAREIQPGDSLVLPLFYWSGIKNDGFTTGDNISFLNTFITSTDIEIYSGRALFTFVPGSGSVDSELMYSFFQDEKDGKKGIGSIFTGLGYDYYNDFLNYFVISNPLDYDKTGSVVKFCIHSNFLVLPEILIISKGTYTDTTVVLNTLKRINIPSFLTNTFISQ